MPDAPGERVKQLQTLNLVVKQLDPDRHLAVLCGKDVDGVATHPKRPTAEVNVIALVLHAHQLGNHVALAHFVARAQGHHHLVVRLGLANAINGRHGGHYHHIAPLQHTFGTTQAHLLNVLIDGRVFFDEQVALRHIGLGLVVIVVAYEILHRIFGKKLAKLAVQLCCKRLVWCKNNSRPSKPRNHIGHGEGFT